MGYCRCLRPSVRPPACLSVRQLYLVRTITRHRFELESPHLHQTRILRYSCLVWKVGVIDLDLQGQFDHFDLRILENLGCPRDHSSPIWAGITKYTLGYSELVFEMGAIDPSRSFWAIWLRILGNLACPRKTCNGFELESPNLHQICILRFSQVLKMGVIDLDRRGHLAICTQNTKKQYSTSLLVYWSRPAKGSYTSHMCSCQRLLGHFHRANCVQWLPLYTCTCQMLTYQGFDSYHPNSTMNLSLWNATSMIRFNIQH